MEWLGVARALHVIGVVLWIGGVGTVTTVMLPVVSKADGSHRLDTFERIEHAFARQARWTTAIVGASGFFMVESLGLWWRFTEARYWWMGAMVAIWAIFTLLLFILEPFVLHRRFATRSRRDPAGTLRLALTLHRVLLAASLVTIAGAVAGSHGVLVPW